MHVAVILQDCLARHTVFACFIPFAKHDENEAIYDNEDEEGARENGD